MIAPFRVGRRLVGPGEPVYIIAEMSGNHNQRFDDAIALVRAAKEAGADAIKLQTYTADTITLKSDKPCFRLKAGTIWDGKVLHDLYREAFTPWEWHKPLRDEAHKLGLDFFSSSFDPSAIDFLEALDVPIHKIASFELVDIPLIQKMARTGKPMILSTGMATLKEIEEAVTAARDAGAKQLAILKCTSAYPSPVEEMNVRTIPHLATKFKVPVGLSDHSMDIVVPVTATALGACLIEKHFTLSRKTPGPDSAFSLEPKEFAAMVQAVRTAEKSLGEIRYGGTEHDQKSRGFRRSLFVVKPVRAGEKFTEENVRSIRPADGLPPKHLPEVIGGTASTDLEAGTPLAWDHMKAKKKAAKRKRA